MRRYNGYTNQTNTASTTAALFNIVGATNARLAVYDIESASDATPADNAAKFALQRTTADFGTPTAVTPRPLDPADPASLALFSAPGGTAVTATANVFVLQWAQNQRATFRWIAAPDGELIIPQGTNQTTTINGLCLMPLVATAAVNYVFSVHWRE